MKEIGTSLEWPRPVMKLINRSAWCFVLVLWIAVPAAAQWQEIAPGVEYRHYREGALDIHVARVDLEREDLAIVATGESDRGTRVSQFAKRNKALIAINAGYFDQNLQPVGLSVGPCGPWEGTRDTTRDRVLAFGPRRAEIVDEAGTVVEPDPWVTAAVSGWPILVSNCRARSSKELPGSDKFTRSPHPRTAVGFSRDGSRLFFVVADGRRETVPGLTLAQLASWMRRRLRVCLALNLDGGGSSAMWVKDEIVNQPSGDSERRVANHVAVVRVEDLPECETPPDDESLLANGTAKAPVPTTSPNGTAKAPVPTTSPNGTAKTPVPTSPPRSISSVPGVPPPPPPPRPR